VRDAGNNLTLTDAQKKAIFGDDAAYYPLNNTDVITVRNANDASCVVEKHNPSAAVFHCYPPGAIVEPADIIMVTNCSDSVITQVTGPSKEGPKDVVVHNQGNIGGITPGNAFQKLRTNYTGNGRILKLSMDTYYVGNTKRTDAAGNVVTALYRVGASRVPEELVEGVEDLQFKYGVDADSDSSFTAEAYRDASGDDGVDAWDNVRTVRLALLQRSSSPNILPSTQTINHEPGAAYEQYPEVKYAGGDHRWRQVYATTVGVRNQLP
jgi:type IV pilus assembly protein PilW